MRKRFAFHVLCAFLIAQVAQPQGTGSTSSGTGRTSGGAAFAGGTVTNATTFSALVTFNGANPAISVPGASGWISAGGGLILNTFADNPSFVWAPANTPDAGELRTGSTSNSIHFVEYADFSFDFNNCSAATSAATDPLLCVHSHNQTTTEWVDVKHNGDAAVIASGSGLLQTPNEAALAADYTNATATFSSTALSRPVRSGRTYSFTLNLTFADSTAADGAQFDFNGGSAAATNFRVQCTASNATGADLVLTNAGTTALATAVQVALALTTQAGLVCNGTFVPSGNGTFIVRAAQTAHTAGTLTVHRGSWLNIRDANPL